MKKKILCAGLNQDFSTYVKNIIEPLGCEITLFQDGNKVLEFLAMNPCDCVIADLDLPEINGFQLYKRAKDLGIKFSYILLANSKAFITAEEAYEVGIESYLMKPITKEVLTDSVVQLLGLGNNNEIASLTPDTDFSSVPISEFFMGGDLQFPIFLKISINKYVAIGKNEKSVDKTVIENLKKNKVQYLYLKKEDFVKYLGFMDFLSEASIRSSVVSIEKKTQIISMASRRILEFSFAEKIDSNYLYFAKNNLSRTVELLGSFGDVADLLESICDQKANLANHNMSTSITALMIAKGRGWTSPLTLFIVSASALFHDIALQPLESQLIKSTPQELSKEDFEKYIIHPTESAALLVRYGKFPEAIVNIIAQHHERPDGSGFPNKLNKTKIHPISEIVNLASEFSHFYLGAPSYGTGMYPRFAAIKIRERFSGIFYEPNIKILEKIFIN